MFFKQSNESIRMHTLSSLGIQLNWNTFNFAHNENANLIAMFVVPRTVNKPSFSEASSGSIKKPSLGAGINLLFWHAN